MNSGHTAALALAALMAPPLVLADAARIDGLITQMTVAEKISFLHGAPDPERLSGAGYIPGVPRLGIPPLRMADGPAGVRVPGAATAFPAPVALASTFAPELARAWGEAVGKEGAAHGQNVLLAPMTNIVRAPLGGRNFETLGEDPLLAARMVSGVVAGLQHQGMIATVKHWAANNQETERQRINVKVDERALREIEMPPFRAAVEAGAGAFMCAYNKVNGTYACENSWLLTDVLRSEWGYAGFVMSDWGATHSAAPALIAGLDIEMPNGRFFGDEMTKAVASGAVSEQQIDRSVRRILTQMERAGLLDRKGARPAFAPHPELARAIAEKGAVLLKNSGALPLTGENLAKIAVIGVPARTPLFGGGGSAAVRPTALDNPYDELVRAAGGKPLPYAVGLDLEGVVIPADALSSTAVNLVGAQAIAAGESWTWTAVLTAPETGDYLIMLHFTPMAGGGGPQEARGALSMEFQGAPNMAAGGMFGGARLLQTQDSLANQGMWVSLRAGETRQMKIVARASRAAPMSLRLSWSTPERRRRTIDEAVAVARTASSPVVFAYTEGTEGRDNPNLMLPDHQDDLIAAVAAANPRTIVVLNTGAPVLMPWVDRVNGLLQMWFPGQAGGAATAALLTGKANPSGRLPVTYPKREQDTPVASPERFPGLNGEQTYGEGIMVGYRWFDQEKVEPLFAFGHGLSYTSFAYSNLSVRKVKTGYEVGVTIKNTGATAGEEVAQVYVGAPNSPPAGLPFAPRALAGFQRVALAPGKSQRVRISVSEQALSYWDVQRRAWQRVAGERPLAVGASSRDIKLSGIIK